MNNVTDIKELSELRTLNLNIFNKQGYPTRKDEEWKQSTLNSFLDRNKQLEIYKEDKELINENVFETFDHHKIISVNGIIQKTDIQSVDKDKINIIPINDYYKKYYKQLSKLFSNKKNPLVAANNALSSNGIYLEIVGNLDLPIVIYHQFSTNINQRQSHQKITYM